MKARPKHVTMVIAVCGALLLGSCGSDGSGSSGAESSADTVEELYEAAKKEGEIIVYGPTMTLNEPVYSKFEEAYPGIEVNDVAMFGPELDARLEAEQATGEGGDLLQIGTPDQSRYRELELLDTLTPIDADSLPEGIVDDENGWVVPSKILFGVVYNADEMAVDEVPSTWAELTDPSLKDKVAVSDPTVRGGSANILAGALESGVIDDDWLADWKENVDPRLFPSTAEAANAVISGEFELQMSAAFGQYANAKAEGAPIEFALLEDGTFEELTPYTLLKGAKHPNAARLLVTWLLSEEGQQAIADINFQPNMPDAPQPAGQPALDGVEIKDWATQDQLTADLEKFDKLLG